MEEIKVTWQLLTMMGAFCGIIIGLVKYIGNRIQSSVDRLVDTTNSHTTEITVERFRNDGQDERLDEHDGKIHAMEQRVWEVTYKKTGP